MSARIIIIGAGITGRLTKIMFPEAVILESKGPQWTYNAEVGVQISITPIPELKNAEYKRYIFIDGEKPTIEAIGRYKKKISRDGEVLTYGDYRQFEHEQVVFKQEFPKNLDIQFNQSVQSIDLSKKTIVTERENGGFHETRKYDYLISTIPLLNFIQISNLCHLFRDDTSAFFMHRPIYLCCTPDPTVKPYVITENYITNADTPIYRENTIDEVRNQESLFKIPNSIKIYPGKIYPTSYSTPILQDLTSYGVFCAGRYAQWDNTMHLWNTYKYLKEVRELI